MRIYGDRKFFYQWDLNQKVTGDFSVGDEIHFSDNRHFGAYVVKAYEYDGVVVADVPNVLLTKTFPIIVYRYIQDGEREYTLEEETFKVKQRQKPTDYVYTETEVLAWKQLHDRISELEKGGVGASNLLVVTVDANNKASHTASEINTFVQGGGSAVLVWFSNVFHAKIITASKCQFGTMFNATTGATEWIMDVDASGKATFSNVVLASLKNPNAITFTGAVEATYDGSKPVGVNIPNKLSEYENDLYYSKESQFLTLHKEDFTLWENPDGDVMALYIVPEKWGWLESAESIKWNISMSMQGQTVQASNEDTGNEFYTDTTDDGGKTFDYYCDYFCISSGYDFKNYNEFVSKEETVVYVFCGTSENWDSISDITLELTKIETKRIESKYLPKQNAVEYVYFEQNDEGAIIPSKTNEEIYKAYIDGKYIIAQRDGENLDLMECYSDYCYFSGYSYNYNAMITIDISDGEVHFDGYDNGVTDMRHWNMLTPINFGSGEYEGLTTFEFTEFPSTNVSEFYLYFKGTSESVFQASLYINNKYISQFVASEANKVRDTLAAHGLVYNSYIMGECTNDNYDGEITLRPFHEVVGSSAISSIKVVFTAPIKTWSPNYLRIFVR